ncbi:uncharacterized protein LOC107637034 [Arachis ipaensis]|uniref:uncharacterized protein LOC107637034 n=1 Tax=Arachis ipaensis TaxID=130454 RepID=UPI0007AF4048|nr:uncharacterized protein LOC107637034 [Arachis ipaensis]
MDPKLMQFLTKYASIFAKPSGLPPQRAHDHCIPLVKDTEPVKARPYRYPHIQKTQIELMVQEMLDEGIIQPGKSPFVSPILLVRKKDGTWRFCTDYHALNNITIKDNFLILTVDELLNELFGAHVFSKLDIRSDYHQILVKPEDNFKMAFWTHQGLYEWLVMPFALTNVPATFQSLMNDVFRSQFSAESSHKTLSNCEGSLVLLGITVASLKVLALPNFELPFEVETDAFGSGVGAVLTQNRHPIDFFSKKLSATMRNQSAYTREFYAITEAIAKFCHDLLGKKFIIHTDQQSLKVLLEQNLHTPEQHKWLHKLLGYDFKIHYKLRVDNVPVNALSRSCFVAWSSLKSDWLHQLKTEIAQDTRLNAIVQQCRDGSSNDANYALRNGILLW